MARMSGHPATPRPSELSPPDARYPTLNSKEAGVSLSRYEDQSQTMAALLDLPRRMPLARRSVGVS